MATFRVSTRPVADDARRRPFRFGIQILRADSAQQWKEKARKAEALGYDVLTIADHFGDRFAYAPALAAAAGVTSDIRLGTLVLQNPFRHPSLHAMEAATIDLLSDGRFELGIGAGGSLMSDFEQTGMPFDPPGFRAGALEESVPIIKALLRGEMVSTKGKYYHFTDFEVFPKAVQQPVPILIGAGGPRMLRLAAREADIISILPLMQPQGGEFHMDETTSTGFRRKVDLIQNTAGTRFEQIEIHMLIQRFAATDQPQPVIDQMSQSWGLSADEVLGSPSMLIGSIDQIVETIQQRREELDLTYYTVFEPDIDNFAPVVKRLKGK